MPCDCSSCASAPDSAAVPGRLLCAGKVDHHPFETAAFEILDHMGDIERSHGDLRDRMLLDSMLLDSTHAGSSQIVTRRFPLTVSAIESTVSNSMRTPSPVSLWMPSRMAT